MLATSRAPLHVLAEHVYAVPPLTYPDSLGNGRTHAHAIDYTQYPAIALFCQRARAVHHAFNLNESNAQDVGEICRRLNGLPLAIELAAARIRLFNPHTILSQLTLADGAHQSATLDLLSAGTRDLPARQQTLRNAITWSYALLTPTQQRLLQHLSVFAGGCTLEAAQAVTERSSAFLIDLQALLDHSLIQYQAPDEGSPRYSLLEMIREFAGEQLEESGEAREARERHLDYYLAFLKSEPAYDAELPDQPGVWPGYISLFRHSHFITTVAWIARFVPERDNVLAALQWSLKEGHSPQKGIELVINLFNSWWSHSLGTEPSDWIALALSHVPTNLPSQQRGRLLCEWARMLFTQGDLPKARALAQEALDIHRALEEDMDILCALYTLADVEFGLGDDDQARAHLRECVAMSHTLKKDRYVGWGLFLLGRIAVQHKDFDEAQRAFDECLAIYPKDDERDVVALYHELGLIACLRGEYDKAVAMHTKSLDLWRSVRAYGLVSMALCGLGDVALFRGDPAQARSLFEESLTLSLEGGLQVRMMLGLAGLAAVYAAEGQKHQAMTLWEAAKAAQAFLGHPRPPFRYDDYLFMIEKAREQLGSAAAGDAAALGRTMALEPAVHYALNLDTPAHLAAHH